MLPFHCSCPCSQKCWPWPLILHSSISCFCFQLEVSEFLQISNGLLSFNSHRRTVTFLPIFFSTDFSQNLEFWSPFKFPSEMPERNPQMDKCFSLYSFSEEAINIRDFLLISKFSLLTMVVTSLDALLAHNFSSSGNSPKTVDKFLVVISILYHPAFLTIYRMLTRKDSWPNWILFTVSGTWILEPRHTETGGHCGHIDIDDRCGSNRIYIYLLLRSQNLAWMLFPSHEVLKTSQGSSWNPSLV